MTQDTDLHWSKTETGQKLIKEAFKTAELPEVPEETLEVGTYTNQQIAEMFPEPMKLVGILMNLPKGGGNASRRSILSFTAEMQ